VSSLEKILYKAWYDKGKLTQQVIDGYKYPLNNRDWDKGLYWVMKYRRTVDINLNSIKGARAGHTLHTL